MPRNIYVIRAKKWNLDPWAAEWITKTVEYCTTSDGKRELEQWVKEAYGTGATKKMREIYQPPPVRFIPRDPQDALDAVVAKELGVTPNAVRLYCEFANQNELCQPARNKPAPQRRRGETAGQWIARLNSALVDGHKIPDMNWQECRAIALSQFDKIQDTIRLFRTDIQFFMNTLMTRHFSYVPPSEILGREEMYIYFHTFDDVFRATVILQMNSYSAWSQCAELFEEFALRGLTTPSSIERAYKRDESLLWKITAAMCSLKELCGGLLAHLSEKIISCEHYRPFFKRNEGVDGRRMVRNDAYINEHGDDLDHFDRMIIDALGTPFQQHSNPEQLLCTIDLAIRQDPSFARRFSPPAYDALGDFAAAKEMLIAMAHSAFGKEFRKQTRVQQDALGAATTASHIGFLRNAPPMPHVAYFDIFGTADCVYSSEFHQWVAESIDEVTVMWGPECKYGDEITLKVFLHPPTFDAIWQRVDEELWEAANRCTRPGEEGRIAKLYGLFDPVDPDRPTLYKLFKQFVEDELLMLLEETAPESIPAHTPDISLGAISIAIPGAKDEAIISGHRYAQAKSESTKTKTRGPAREDPPAETEVPAQITDWEALPDVLPQSYKLNRKVVKTFHRLLDGKYDAGDKPGTPKKGQVRWNEFEKAMKRVGFTVVQTTGSSVRFDPPAKSARPITFHRVRNFHLLLLPTAYTHKKPHPDPLLTPAMISEVGGRLARCYGWTINTFEVGMHELH